MNFLSLIIVKPNNDNTISSLHALVSQMIIENQLSNQPMYLKCAILYDFSNSYFTLIHRLKQISKQTKNYLHEP